MSKKQKKTYETRKPELMPIIVSPNATRKTFTPFSELIPTGFVNEKNLHKVLSAMQKNKGEIDTYAVTKLVYGETAYARNYRFATGNFMRRLADRGWVRWNQKNVGYRGTIVMYELTPKGELLLETLKP